MSKKLNIIEAMKMPIGSTFNVEYSNGSVALENIVIKEEESTPYLVWSSNENVRVFCDILDATFIPIQQPVSFMEAVKKAKTNRFVIEHEKWKLQSAHTLLATLHILVNELKLGNDEIADIISNSKCYIEESEADSNE